METRDHEEHDEQRAPIAPGRRARQSGNGGPHGRHQVIGTDDPPITSGPAYHPDWTSHPDRDHGHRDEPDPRAERGVQPELRHGPRRVEPGLQDRSGAGNGKEGEREQRSDDEERDTRTRKGGAERHGTTVQIPGTSPESGDQNVGNDQGTGPKPLAQSPSLTRMLLSRASWPWSAGSPAPGATHYFFGSDEVGRSEVVGARTPAPARTPIRARAPIGKARREQELGHRSRKDRRARGEAPAGGGGVDGRGEGTPRGTGGGEGGAGIRRKRRRRSWISSRTRCCRRAAPGTCRWRRPSGPGARART